MATPHDARIKTFIAELKRLYLGTQTLGQLMDLATQQEVNLDGDSDDVHQAFLAVTMTTIPAATVPQAGGAATHLYVCLCVRYEITTDETGSKNINIEMCYEQAAGNIRCAMKGYMGKVVARFDN